jgi:hypothetical protein
MVTASNKKTSTMRSLIECAKRCLVRVQDEKLDFMQAGLRSSW